MANQNKLPSVIVSVDASNCFDRVVHPIAGMTCQHFGLPLDFVTNFFGTIKNMKIYLMIAHGMSTNFYSGQYLSFQGLTQENAAASPGFLFIVIISIKYLLYEKLIPESMLPITNKKSSLAGQIFVNDSEFSITNEGNESELQIGSTPQEALDAWHEGLKFTGRELKLNFFYCTIQSFTWKDNLPKLIIEQK